MDAPPIQYARTEDGVNIAYWTVGDGPTLLHMPILPAVHAQLEWDIPGRAAWYEALAPSHKVVHYDPRGFGLSTHNLDDLSLDALIEDIPAVLSAASSGPVTTFAIGGEASALALALAARYPDAVERMIFWNPTALAEHLVDVWHAIDALADVDWSLFTRVAAEIMTGFERAAAEPVGATIREGATPLSFRAWRDLSGLRDAVALAPPHPPPALVLHNRSKLVGANAHRLAAALPGSELRGFPSDSFTPWSGKDGTPLREVLDTIRAFAPGVASAGSGSRDILIRSGVRTILFTDLESSTALTQAVGDDRAQGVLHGHNDIVRKALQSHGGEEVKHTGDGIMAAFGSAVSAVEAGLQIQQDLAAGEVPVRIGLNAGEPIQEDGDYFGSAVQLAARVCDRAEPGQVLVPQVVRDLCRGKTFTFEDQGEATLKGFPEPVRLFVVAGDVDYEPDTA